MNEEEKKLPEESMETAPSDPFDQAVPEEEGPGGEKDIVPEQGLDLDNYEKTEPFVKGERVEDSIAGIPITYDLTPDEVTRALKYFQKKTIYKKNLIFTDPSYALGYILGFLALTVIGFMWYLPAKHIKSVAQAVSLSRESYHLEICADGLLLPQKEGKFLVGFDAPAMHVTEFPDLFLIIVSQEKMFAIPKRCVDPERLDELTKMMKNALGGRYEVQQDAPSKDAAGPEGSGKED